MLTCWVPQNDLGVLAADRHCDLLQTGVQGDVECLGLAHILVDGQEVHLSRLHRHSHEVQHLSVKLPSRCCQDTEHIQRYLTVTTAMTVMAGRDIT